MWDHNRDTHMNLDMTTDDFQFNIINTFSDPMTRQIEEAVRIQHSITLGLHTDRTGKTRRVKSLNRKHEYFCPRKRNNF